MTDRNILIQEYRGWEITFNKEDETFNAVSNEYDSEIDKKSFSATKTYIDDYIKKNQKFKPVMVQTMNDMFRSGNAIKLIGIRKDGRFMYEDEEGKKQQLSSYYEDHYFLVDEENDSVFKEMKELDDKIKLLQKEKTDLEKKVIKVGLDTIKEKYQDK